MPLRTKLLLTVLVVGALAILSGLALLAYFLPHYAVLWLLLDLGALGLFIYLRFVYDPRFDCTGQTRVRLRVKPPRVVPKVVALTFDDGPSEHTRPILEILARKQVKATFFCLGHNARKYPESVKAIVEGGHALGNHGLRHRKMHRLTAEEIREEILEAEKILGPLATLQIAGKPPLKLLRPPHGLKCLALLRVIKELGYVLISWTIGVWDSDQPGVKVICERVKEQLHPGAILLLHDGDGINPAPKRSQTVAALPEIIDELTRQGYRFCTIPELFAENA